MGQSGRRHHGADGDDHRDGASTFCLRYCAVQRRQLVDLLWGAVPLSSQLWLLSSSVGLPQPASPNGVATIHLSIAAGARLGALLPDSAGLTTVFAIGSSFALAAPPFAVANGRDAGGRNHLTK